jgi:hypothetical protein
VSTTVVVVDVVDVLVDDVVDVLVEVDVVVVGLVDVVGLPVVAAASATTLPPVPSPQAVRPSRAVQPTANHCRRMTHSASENQCCNVAAAACWPERMQAGIPMPW